MQRQHPGASMAEFGMAMPYFTEIVELNNVKVVQGSPVAHSLIGQLFGEQAVIVTGVTTDGQRWRAIYPHETSDCWVTPEPQGVRRERGWVGGAGGSSLLDIWA
jgi:hypothetical protein